MMMQRHKLIIKINKHCMKIKMYLCQQQLAKSMAYFFIHKEKFLYFKMEVLHIAERIIWMKLNAKYNRKE